MAQAAPQRFHTFISYANPTETEMCFTNSSTAYIAAQLCFSTITAQPGIILISIDSL